MSNPILICGNTYMSKPLYISFKVAEFWGVLSLRSLTSHILSCFFCSFTSASISSNCNSWCAVIAPVHTFCALLLQEEELLSCGIPRVDKDSTGVQSSLPACQHLGECLWHAHQPLCSQPWIQVPSMHRAVTRDTFLWFHCEICTRSSHLCQCLSFCVYHTHPNYQGVRDAIWYPPAATVDFLLLCTLISNVFPPAQGHCEERYENGAERASIFACLGFLLPDCLRLTLRDICLTERMHLLEKGFSSRELLGTGTVSSERCSQH